MSNHADTIRKALECYYRVTGGDGDPSTMASLAALDALVAERDAANVEWHKIRDLHADAISEVARLREALTEAKAQIGHGAFCNCVVCLPLIAALAAPTSKEGT